MGYFLYILRSEVKETYYIGMSKKPGQRLYYHNKSDKQMYTLRYRPWTLKYTHQFETREEALAAEAKVKSWKSTKMIRLLVAGAIDIQDYL